MKWKKDSFFDSIESIHKSLELKPIISLKNIIAAADSGTIPVSDVSKKGKELGIPIKVARFLRQYPSFFEEFVGAHYDLPWFRLTNKAIELDREEKEVYRVYKDDLQDRLKKLILMSGENRVPIKIIKGLQWNLGLPNEFINNPENNLDGCFRVVEMEEGLKGLAIENDSRVLSVLQKNGIKRGLCKGEPMETISFPLFPSKGLRLKKKIIDWLEEFGKVPYVSPYDDYSSLETDSDVAEKRVVGVIHELLSLFVENASERKNFIFLKKYLGLPQKVHKAFERHPHMFYLSLRNKTCTAILKEAYCDVSAIEPHPLSGVRKKYIRLMNESRVILKNRRVNNGSLRCAKELPKLDLDDVEDENTESEEPTLYY